MAREPLGWELDPRTPLHQFRQTRHEKDRDCKIIITSRNSTTGTGKTTLAAALCLHWDDEWTAEDRATLDVNEFLSTYQDLPEHSCLLMDEAEQLDARRSMSQQNVDFAEKWMMMRVRQVDSILTLPTASALDKRLLELADVRINIVRRGFAKVYKITVDDHDTSTVREWHWHDLEWPDISSHPEVRALHALKDEKLEGKREAAEEEEVDPAEVARQQKIEAAQRARNNGFTCVQASEIVDMSKGWVVENTENPDKRGDDGEVTAD